MCPGEREGVVALPNRIPLDEVQFSRLYCFRHTGDACVKCRMLALVCVCSPISDRLAAFVCLSGHLSCVCFRSFISLTGLHLPVGVTVGPVSFPASPYLKPAFPYSLPAVGSFHFLDETHPAPVFLKKDHVMHLKARTPSQVFSLCLRACIVSCHRLRQPCL